MKKKYTIVKIKVDKVTVADLTYLKDMLYGQVPSHASVEIRTDATGTHLTFEWPDLSELTYDQQLKAKKAIKNNWYPNDPNDKY